MATNEDLRNSRSKFNRVYSEEELALFARYVKARRVCAPDACDDGVVCWARQGPPGMMGYGGALRCAGCLTIIPNRKPKAAAKAALLIAQLRADVPL